MYAELFGARLCNKGEGSDFCGGQRRIGGERGDEELEEEDMGAAAVTVVLVFWPRPRGSV
jgi:hypothetical protein